MKKFTVVAEFYPCENPNYFPYWTGSRAAPIMGPKMRCALVVFPFWGDIAAAASADHASFAVEFT